MQRRYFGIQLAKAKKKKQIQLKCEYQDCTNGFVGYPNAKYCKDHKNPKSRITTKEKIQSEICFFEFEHNFENQTIIERSCDLKGCTVVYKLNIYPTQKIYPKFCDEHRNEFKRKYFIERLKR